MLTTELFIITALCTQAVILGIYSAKEPGLILEPLFKWLCPKCSNLEQKNKLPDYLLKPLIGCIYCMPSFWSLIGITTSVIIFQLEFSYVLLIQWLVMTCGLSFMGGFLWKINKKL